MTDTRNRVWPDVAATEKLGAFETLPSGSAARSSARGPEETLGEPLTIKDVAGLVGCSPWTVRQVLIPRGLPCFRAAANGRLIFYRQQVVQWVLRQQQHRKGRP